MKDEATALIWIGDQLEWNLGRYEAPLLARMMAAWMAGDEARLAEFDAQYLASRETAELRAETLQMGHSLHKLIGELHEHAVPPSLTFCAVWASLAAAWNIAPAEALTAWLEARRRTRPWPR